MIYTIKNNYCNQLKNNSLLFFKGLIFSSKSWAKYLGILALCLLSLSTLRAGSSYSSTYSERPSYLSYQGRVGPRSNILKTALLGALCVSTVYSVPVVPEESYDRTITNYNGTHPYQDAGDSRLVAQTSRKLPKHLRGYNNRFCEQKNISVTR